MHSEQKTRNDLAAARLGTNTVHGVDEAEAARKRTRLAIREGIVEQNRRGGVHTRSGRKEPGSAIGRKRVEHAVENVLKFHAHGQVDLAIPGDREDPANVEGFLRLALPAILVEPR